jgi:GNAT superfamily N-acetyltransferase
MKKSVKIPEIYPALPEHANQLTQITISAKRHWDYPENWMQLWIPVLTISSEYISENETWIAVGDDTPIAYYSLKYDGGYLWLDNLWVLPEHMGRGIGRQLLQHALERGHVRGESILKIEADPNAQSFYEKMGARQIGEHHGEVDGQVRVLPVMEISVSSHT